MTNFLIDTVKHYLMYSSALISELTKSLKGFQSAIKRSIESKFATIRVGYQLEILKGLTSNA